MNLDAHYLIWQLVEQRYAYTMKPIEETDLMRSGDSLVGRWPTGAYAVLNEPAGVTHPFLPDSLFNAQKRLFVSNRLKSFLDAQQISDVEFWPIKILDATGLPLGAPYYYVHLFNHPSCLDLDESQAVRSRVAPSVAEKVKMLAFHRNPERPLFRPAEFSKIALVHWPLAENLAEEGFSGFRLMGLFDYGLRGDLPPDPRRRPVDALCAKLNRKRNA